MSPRLCSPLCDKSKANTSPMASEKKYLILIKLETWIYSEVVDILHLSVPAKHYDIQKQIYFLHRLLMQGTYPAGQRNLAQKGFSRFLLLTDPGAGQGPRVLSVLPSSGKKKKKPPQCIAFIFLSGVITTRPCAHKETVPSSISYTGRWAKASIQYALLSLIFMMLYLNKELLPKNHSNSTFFFFSFLPLPFSLQLLLKSLCPVSHLATSS